MGVVMAPPTPLQIAYIDPDGGSWNLSDRSMQSGYACSAIAGIEGLPVSMGTFRWRRRAGELLCHSRVLLTLLAVLIGWPASGAGAITTRYWTVLCEPS